MPVFSENVLHYLWDILVYELHQIISKSTNSPNAFECSTHIQNTYLF